MKTPTLILLLIIGFNLLIHSQQDAQFSQNNFNKLSFNPAYAGMRHSFCITALHRNQWNGFPGAPKNFLVSGDLFLRSFGGIGITILNDQLGLDRTNIFKFAGSFHVRPLGEGTLGIGIEAGAVQKTFGNGWIYNDAGDPLIPLNSISNTIWDLGLGVYYEIERSLFIGISTSHIPQSEFKSKTSATKFYTSVRHYFLTTGVTIFLNNPSISIQPSLLAKTDGSSTQIDFNTIISWENLAWVGASYRLTDAFILMAGIQRGFAAQSIIKVGYSYDITTSNLKNHSSGSHELLLSICTPIPDKPRNTTWDNVRYMYGANPF